MRDDMILCQQKVAEVLAQVNQIVIGKEECVRKVMAAILAGGHILLEDIPGVGKTTLAMAFSETMALQNNRLQGYGPGKSQSTVHAGCHAIRSIRFFDVSETDGNI